MNVENASFQLLIVTLKKFLVNNRLNENRKFYILMMSYCMQGHISKYDR